MKVYGVDARGRLRQRNSKKNPIIANHGVVSVGLDGDPKIKAKVKVEELPWTWNQYKEMERTAKNYTIFGKYMGMDEQGNDIVRIG